MIAHQAEAQYHHIVLQNAQGDIIHRRNKIFPALKNIVLLQRRTTHMIVIFLFPLHITCFIFFVPTRDGPKVLRAFWTYTHEIKKCYAQAKKKKADPCGRPSYTIYNI